MLAWLGYALSRPQEGPGTAARNVEPPTPHLSPVPASPLLAPSPSSRSIIPAEAQRVRVKSVADGDTVTLDDGRKVRYIGIDTPEHNEPFFDEAKGLNSSLVTGRDVFLEYDVERQDNYGRSLAYIYVRLDNGDVMVNAEILRQGLARMYTFPPNLKHVDTMRAMQREAIESQRGQWKSYVFSQGVVATRNGRAFHKPSCDQIAKTKPENLTRYSSAKEALADDKSPCRTCKP